MAKLASRLAVVGAGRMAEAMMGPLITGGLQRAIDTHVYDVNQERMDLYSGKWAGIGVHQSATDCVAGADLVLLAVKPQHMPAVCEVIAPSLLSSALVVSIAAGCPISLFAKALPTASVVRAMPNTPALVGKGMSVWTATEGCSAEQRATARALFKCFGEEHATPTRVYSHRVGSHTGRPTHAGEEHYVDEEHYLDTATALSGSGPAYALT